MATTVLIVDDHPAFRAIARQLLELEGYDVIAEAQDGAQAAKAADELHPDVVLLDVHLPDTNGFTLARQLTQHAERAPTVILTSSLDLTGSGTSIVADSGARGFIPKSELSAAALTALIS